VRTMARNGLSPGRLKSARSAQRSRPVGIAATNMNGRFGEAAVQHAIDAERQKRAGCASAAAKRSLPPHLVQMSPRGSFEAFAARVANVRTLIGRSFDQPPARPPEPPRRLPVFLRQRPTTPLTLLRSDGFRFS
jgi:hypothetical protein